LNSPLLFFVLPDDKNPQFTFFLYQINRLSIKKNIFRSRGFYPVFEDFLIDNSMAIQ